jgi:hypothetical protein
VQKKNVGLKRNGIWLAVMALFISELFFYAWCRVQYTNVSYEISNILDRQNTLLQLQKNLTIELARLQSPKKLSKVAYETLNLIIPTPDQMVTLP